MLVSIGQLLTTELPTDISSNKCGVGLQRTNLTYCRQNTSLDVSSIPTDWTNSGVLFVSVTFLGFLLFTMFFYPTYKRLEVDKEAETKHDKNF